MSSVSEARTKNSKLISAVYASAATAFLAGQISAVQAGVFEQTCSGKVITMGSGALSGASLPGKENSSGDGPQAVPTSIIQSSLSRVADSSDVPAGASLAADSSPPSSLCDDPPVGTTKINMGSLEVVRQLNDKLNLPAPKRLSSKFSDRQMEMREKAADVGQRFSSYPGVRKAKLDAPVFMKLFTTLVQRESGFEPRAVSPVGARGLGQLMPSTARALGVKDSFAPDENLVGAATYLTDMLDKFGSTELALAAYNAGPGAVEKYRGIPPYRETRQYVADIFNEVLREPYPLYLMSRVTLPENEPNFDVLLTALAAEEPAPVAHGAFAAVLKETARRTEPGTAIQLAAYAGTSEIATVQKQPFKVNGSDDLLNRVSEQDHAQEQKQQKHTASIVGSDTGNGPFRLTPVPPDQVMLPKPRVFVGQLSKAQQVLRDTAVDIALAQAKASSVERAGLTQAAFATLFVALVRRESSFNRQAISLDGAKGLGQLKPETLSALSVKDPFSAEENLQASVTHFIRLLDKFNSPVLALAAYNAGAVTVQKAGGLPGDQKTRQFISDVLYDINQDPAPDFVVARLHRDKQSGVLAGSATHGMPQDVTSDRLRHDSIRSKPSESADSSKSQVKAPDVKKPVNPTLAATISPTTFYERVTGKLTLEQLIGALGFAFLFTCFCRLIVDLSHSGRRRSPSWSQESPQPDGRTDTTEGAGAIKDRIPETMLEPPKQGACPSNINSQCESKVAA